MDDLLATALRTLWCCNEHVMTKPAFFPGAFAGLNILMEDGISYINSGYSPRFDNARFTALEHGAYLSHNCSAAHFYCIFRHPQCESRSTCGADNVSEASRTWRAAPALAQVQTAAAVMFRPVALLEEQLERVVAKLPAAYASVHIRRGDKLTATGWELITLPTAAYFADVLRNHSDVLVASDDDDFVEDVQRRLGTRTTLWTVVRREESETEDENEPRSVRNGTRRVGVSTKHELGYLYLLTRLLARGAPFVFSSVSNVPIFAMYHLSHSRIVDVEDIVREADLLAEKFVCSPPFGSRSGVCSVLPRKVYFVETVSRSSTTLLLLLAASMIATRYIRRRGDGPDGGRRRRGDAWAVGIAWVAGSIATILLNKVLAALCHPVLLVVLQMCYTAGIALILAGPRPPWSSVGAWLVRVSVLFPVQLVTSMLALRDSSVGAYVVIRNVSPVLTLLVEQATTRRCPTERQKPTAAPTCSFVHVVAVACMIGGAVMYEGADVRSSPRGIVFLVANLVVASAERVMTRRTLQTHMMPNEWAVLLNNSMCLPLALGLWACQGSLLDYRQFHRSVMETPYAYAFLASCLSASLLAFGGVALQRAIQASTFLAFTSLNKAIVVVVAVCAFGESAAPLAALGVLLNIAGAVGFSVQSERPSDVSHAALRVYVHLASCAWRRKRVAMRDEVVAEAE